MCKVDSEFAGKADAKKVVEDFLVMGIEKLKATKQKKSRKFLCCYEDKANQFLSAKAEA